MSGKVFFMLYNCQKGRNVFGKNDKSFHTGFVSGFPLSNGSLQLRDKEWDPCLTLYTVELQWLEHLWDYENKFEPGVVRANEG